MKILVTSDWHGDATTAGVERYEDVEAAALEVLDAAINDAGLVDAFFFLGDLTDPDPPRCWRAAELAIRIAKELHTAGIPSVWLTGNHDVLEDGNGSHTLQPLKATGFGWVVDGPGVSSVIPGIKFLALPFVARSNNYDPIEVVKRSAGESVQLVVGHLNVEGIEPGSESSEFARGRDVFLPLAQIKQAWPNAVVCNGHYHRPQEYHGVHVPGSLVRLTRAEANNTPGYLMIEV